MGAVAVLVGGLGAPLGVAVGGAQVGDHDGDGVAFARAVALAVGRHVAGVGELVALPASAAAPAAGASEQVLRPGRREDGAAVAGLPRGHRSAAAASTGARLAVIVVLSSHGLLDAGSFNL